MPSPFIGRQTELGELNGLDPRTGPHVAFVTGPRGVGKSTLLREAFPAGEGVIRFEALPLPGAALFRGVEEAVAGELGTVPRSRTPGILPDPRGREWLSLFLGVTEWMEEEGRPLTLILDGFDHLPAAHREFPTVLREVERRVRSRALPLTLVLASRTPEPDPDRGDLPSPTRLPLGPLPARAVGWAQGGRDPEDAYLRWTIFGNHPPHLPDGGAPTTLEEAVVERLLTPGAPLWNAHLARLEAIFQRPNRYAATLMALAEGPLEWGGVVSAAGVETGAQLAPYLRRLEEEGFIESVSPLEAPEGSRRRRYALLDPGLAFWCREILPRRSRLTEANARSIWRDEVAPNLNRHAGGWFPVLAREWLRDHASELLPASARRVGGVWGEEVEFDVVARLANGHVCYGMVRWEGGDDPGVGATLTDRMNRTRFGIGREGRTPLYFLRGDGSPELRREVARTPLARIISMETLMGTPEGSGR